jgi:probable phosphoglycerate mutase
MTIFLVRHGETAGNASRVIQRGDVPLNQRGIQQAARLAARLGSLGFAHILCSDLLRARMTAEPIGAHSGLEVEVSELLQERNFGDLRGTPYAELTENPFGPDFAPPNGETWAVFYARVAKAFELIVERRRTLRAPLVVVTHGLVCRAIIDQHARMAAGVIAPDRFDNTSLTILRELAPHDVHLLNCTIHLNEESAAQGGGAA